MRVIIAPNDLRRRGAILHDEAPPWVGQLYRTITTALREYPLRLE